MLLRQGGLDELDLVPSALMAADGSKSDGLVALDDSAPLEWNLGHSNATSRTRIA